MKYLVQRKRPRRALRIVGRLPKAVRRRLLHRASLGEWPKVRSPQSYADVGTALLLGKHDLLVVIAGDKDASKTFVRGLTDQVKVPRTRWLGTDPSTIPDSALEGRWAAKLNAGSGAASAGEGPEDRRQLEDFVRSWSSDEAASIFCSSYYEDARPGVVIEDYIDGLAGRPTEIKFYCFGGLVEFALVYQYDQDGERVSGYVGRDGRPKEISKVVNGRVETMAADVSGPPTQFLSAIEAAEKLAGSFAHVRVDLYVVGEELWFGELTPYPNAALVRFEPQWYDHHLANLWLQSLGEGRTSPNT